MHCDFQQDELCNIATSEGKGRRVMTVLKCREGAGVHAEQQSRPGANAASARAAARAPCYVASYQRLAAGLKQTSINVLTITVSTAAQAPEFRDRTVLHLPAPGFWLRGRVARPTAAQMTRKAAEREPVGGRRSMIGPQVRALHSAAARSPTAAAPGAAGLSPPAEPSLSITHVRNPGAVNARDVADARLHARRPHARARR